MNVSSIDKLALDLSTARVADARRKGAEVAAPEPAAAESAAQGGLGLDLTGMEDAHSLDAARVAALIADPFGEE